MSSSGSSSSSSSEERSGEEPEESEENEDPNVARTSKGEAPAAGGTGFDFLLDDEEPTIVEQRRNAMSGLEAMSHLEKSHAVRLLVQRGRLAESHPKAKGIFTTRERGLLNTTGFFPKQRPSFHVPLTRETRKAGHAPSIFTAEPFDDEKPAVWENELRGNTNRMEKISSFRRHQEKVRQQIFDSEKAAAKSLRERRAANARRPVAGGSSTEAGPGPGTDAKAVEKEGLDDAAAKKAATPQQAEKVFHRLTNSMTAARKSKVREIRPTKRPLTAKELFYHQKHPSHLNIDDFHFDKLRAEAHFEFADSLRCTHTRPGERRASLAAAEALADATALLDYHKRQDHLVKLLQARDEALHAKEREEVSHLMQFYGPEDPETGEIRLPEGQEWWTKEQIEEARQKQQIAHEAIRTSAFDEIDED
jgi:hypothetical protein